MTRRVPNAKGPSKATYPRAALLIAVLLLALTGCGSSGPTSQRPAVAHYLTQVNRIESELAKPLRSVTVVGDQFARMQATGTSASAARAGASAQRTLVTAAAQMRTLRARLATLSTPPPATHLRALLLQLVDAQLSLTRQLAKLIVFLPRFSEALRPLAPATRQLDTALSQRTAYGPSGVAAVYASKGAALRRYGVQLRRVATQLRRLDPPTALQGDLRRQLRSLEAMSSAAVRLATSLEHGSSENAQALLLEFNRAAGAPQSLAAQKAHNAAARGYNAQIARLARLAAAASRERLALSSRLG